MPKTNANIPKAIGWRSPGGHSRSWRVSGIPFARSLRALVRAPRFPRLVDTGIWGGRFFICILAEDMVVDIVELRRFDRRSSRLCDHHADITEMMVEKSRQINY